MATDVDTFNMQALTGELTADEGVKLFVYTDTTGNKTIGIGHNLDANGLTIQAINSIFHEDVQKCCVILDTNVIWWRQLEPARQRIMINLCFNLGWRSLSTFRLFLKAMASGDYEEAAAQLEDSKWFTQVKSRGPRLINRLLAGGN